MIHFVVHEEGDGVGVVVVEGVKAGQELDGWIMEDDKDIKVTARNDIPIGHKLALQRLPARATPSSSTASTSARWCSRSARASICTCTTSRPSAGRQHGPVANRHFWGYQRENGRVGVRNHVIILPVDDLSNAAAQAVANNIKGTLAIPHPYGRLQFGADLELHFRTLIGTGSNPNVAAVVVIGIEDGWTKKVVDGIAKTGKPVAGFGIEGTATTTPSCAPRRRRKEFVQWASELRREERPLKELWVSTKCGESDTTSGCGANPDGRQRLRQALPARRDAGVRRDHRAHRRRAPGRGALPQRRGAQEVPVHVRPLPGSHQPPQDQRPVRLAAHQGQHRRRPHHDRGEGARQHPEDRPQVHGRRRARQGRDADRARACGSWIRPRPRRRW